MTVSKLLRHPTAFLPLAMSAAALALVLGYVTVHGVTRQADEGTAAHLWQMLMAGQVPIIAFFAIRWMQEFPRQTAAVLALQLAGAAAALAPVAILGF